MYQVGVSAGVLRQGTLHRMETVRDVARVLDTPGLRSALEGELMAQPAFAARYANRARSNRETSCPPGSLGAVQEDFRAWYGLGPNFFPATLEADASPLEFAACLLARDHDAYHVLCAYETSDADEVALASFLCAQTPGIYACFVGLLESSQELADTRFKHLRDLLDSALDHEAMHRGRAAAVLVTVDLLASRVAQLSELRHALAIPPRSSPPGVGALRNTCGGRRVSPYFFHSKGPLVRHHC